MTMQVSNSEPRPRPLRSALQVARLIATSRPGSIAIAAAVIGSGLALNWSGLVAVGAAPLILGILPCAAMCAVGLCMPMGRAKKHENPVIDRVDRHQEPLIIEATARASAVPSQSSPGSLPSP